MGRNKFSQTEIIQIAKLLRLKNAGNRAQQKQVRHELRVNYEFNISDFNEPGRAFGEDELQLAIHRGAIQILDDATIVNLNASARQRKVASRPTGNRLCESGRTGKKRRNDRTGPAHSQDCSSVHHSLDSNQQKMGENQRHNASGFPPSRIDSLLCRIALLQRRRGHLPASRDGLTACIACASWRVRPKQSRQHAQNLCGSRASRPWGCPCLRAGLLLAVPGCVPCLW